MRLSTRVAVLSATALLATACSSAPAQQQPAPSAPPVPTSSAAPDGSFTVVATGDVLIHPAITDQAAADAKTSGQGEYDYRPLLGGVKPLISGADLAICHLETPLAKQGGPYSGYPSFSAPPEVADAIKDTGYDTCSTSSNHTLDQGEAGITRTLDKLDQAGIKHTGSARTAKEAATPLIMDVKGVKVAQVSFAFGFNGIEVPKGKPYLANRIVVEDVIKDAKAAKAAGAEVVIASLHWGTEYQHEITKDQEQQAKKLLADKNIDLIIGHHAHVVQPFEEVNGKWVAYGLGNSVAKHSDPRGSTEEGAAARFRFVKGADGWKVDKAEFLPTLMQLTPQLRLFDLTENPSGERGAEALKATSEVVLSRGAEKDGLTRPGR
jgi:poly-gamma-glutamate capsule biosynthesis protein CapA/YwtB (metallophosphatase superfamily)